jgi:FKBP-type peptidyl-prolyl cis-trans isomerase SlyD
VSDVREATEEELEDGHPQGAFGLDVDDESDMDVDEEPPAQPVVQRPTLH